LLLKVKRKQSQFVCVASSVCSGTELEIGVWCATLGEEQGLRESLGGTALGPKRKEVTGDRKKLQALFPYV